MWCGRPADNRARRSGIGGARSGRFDGAGAARPRNESAQRAQALRARRTNETGADNNERSVEADAPLLVAKLVAASPAMQHEAQEAQKMAQTKRQADRADRAAETSCCFRPMGPSIRHGGARVVRVRVDHVLAQLRPRSPRGRRLRAGVEILERRHRLRRDVTTS